ncbi:helix-turn-helix domain-containing protein [Spirosoma endbachense]|uniref:Helix-turn-helix domain-containing protein n=1 Tax=Spirosoma endbachense TaxID=2666025 RepID=A0A6P1VVJ8_9BACT|nr:helix-turn-helix domain-containing protein [Spirosoma endbachense]QHV95679.1 helix-turn-helix domain-containing protein [Spirosoma endbachense]
MGRIATSFILSEADLTALNQLLSKGKDSVRKLNRVRALQFSHLGHSPEQISQLLIISIATVYNLRKRYDQEGLQRAINEKSRPGQPRKVTQQVEVQITQLACSQAPDGRTRWTANLINEKLVKLDIHIDDESVRLVLKKVSLSLGSKSSAGPPGGALGR